MRRLSLSCENREKLFLLKKQCHIDNFQSSSLNGLNRITPTTEFCISSMEYFLDDF